MNEFYQEALENKLNKLLISEPVPTEKEPNHFYKVVGSNFKDLVIKSKESCLLLFCDNFDQKYCSFPLSVLRYFAKLAHEKQVHIRLGYFDTSKNEVELITIFCQ